MLPWIEASFAEAAALGNVTLLRAKYDDLLCFETSDWNEHPMQYLDATTHQGQEWEGQYLHQELKRTPLMLAALGGHERMAKMLLAMGVDATLKDTEGKTALQQAASNAVRSLLASAPSVAVRKTRNERLALAAREGDTQGVEAALAEGAFTEAMGDESDFMRGIFPLHRACTAGDMEMVKALLAHGAHTDVACLWAGETPLFQACQHGHVEVVKALLDAGANLELRDVRRNGYHNPLATPLSVAVSYGHADGLLSCWHAVPTPRPRMRRITHRLALLSANVIVS